MVVKRKSERWVSEEDAQVLTSWGTALTLHWSPAAREWRNLNVKIAAQGSPVRGHRPTILVDMKLELLGYPLQVNIHNVLCFSDQLWEEVYNFLSGILRKVIMNVMKCCFKIIQTFSNTCLLLFIFSPPLKDFWGIGLSYVSPYYICNSSAKYQWASWLSEHFKLSFSNLSPPLIIKSC